MVIGGDTSAFYRVPEPPIVEFSVTITKDIGHKLGLQVGRAYDGKIIVVGFNKDYILYSTTNGKGPAEQPGVIAPGDFLVGIEQERVTNHTFSEVISCLQNCLGSITLHFHSFRWPFSVPSEYSPTIVAAPRKRKNISCRPQVMPPCKKELRLPWLAAQSSPEKSSLPKLARPIPRRLHAYGSPLLQAHSLLVGGEAAQLSPSLPACPSINGFAHDAFSGFSQNSYNALPNMAVQQNLWATATAATAAATAATAAAAAVIASVAGGATAAVCGVDGVLNYQNPFSYSSTTDVSPSAALPLAWTIPSFGCPPPAPPPAAFPTDLSSTLAALQQVGTAQQASRQAQTCREGALLWNDAAKLALRLSAGMFQDPYQITNQFPMLVADSSSSRKREAAPFLGQEPNTKKVKHETCSSSFIQQQAPPKGAWIEAVPPPVMLSRNSFAQFKSPLRNALPLQQSADDFPRSAPAMVSASISPQVKETKSPFKIHQNSAKAARTQRGW